MKNIIEIYKEYNLMPNLQEHQLRVAAVVKIICDNITTPVNSEIIVIAGLLHDMGNIIKFDLEYFPELNKPEGLDYWLSIQKEYIQKYGEDEHKATIVIMKELEVNPEIVRLVDSMSFRNLCDQATSEDFSVKIIQYADMRVGPYGVLSYEDRMIEGIKRYKNHKKLHNAIQEDERKRFIACGAEIENQIFAKCKIKPEDINDESVGLVIDTLREFVLK